MSILFVADVETTGLNPMTAGIVEVGCVAIRGGHVVSEWSSLVWPGREYLGPENRRALYISGITIEELLDAPEPEFVRDCLDAWMQSITQSNEAPPVTSYNLPFDRAFLMAHLGVEESTFPWAPCIMAQARAAMAYTGRYGPSLARTCEWLGIEREEQHRALADARDAGRVWLKLTERSEVTR